MQLTVNQHADATVIVPVGRIDQATAEDFLKSLQAQLAGRNSASPPLLLDFSGIDYISSVGLRLDGQRTSGQGQRLRHWHCCIAANGAGSLPRSRFDLVIACYDTIESAMRTLTSSCK